jgi:hypothetical protein
VVVAAASFDDAIAITGYTIFISIALAGESNKAWHIAQGPLSVVLGAALGAAAALLCSATKLWSNRYKRTAIVFFSGAPPCGQRLLQAWQATGKSGGRVAARLWPSGQLSGCQARLRMFGHAVHEEDVLKGAPGLCPLWLAWCRGKRQKPMLRRGWVGVGWYCCSCCFRRLLVGFSHAWPRDAKPSQQRRC